MHQFLNQIRGGSCRLARVTFREHSHTPQRRDSIKIPMRDLFSGRPWAGTLEYLLDGESRGTGRPQYRGTCKNTGLPHVQEENEYQRNEYH